MQLENGDYSGTNVGSSLAFGFSGASGIVTPYIQALRSSDNANYNLAINPNGGNVAIGAMSPGSYKLAVEGKIGAREVIVTNAEWSDYVFRPGYRLRPLSEVSAFIEANHHLPEIPSEAEVRANGVSLGDVQAKLLAKIEELTLHMIAEHARNNRLEAENLELQRRMGRMEQQAVGPEAKR